MLNKTRYESIKTLMEGKTCPFCGSSYIVSDKPYFLPAMPSEATLTEGHPQTEGIPGDGLLKAVCKGCKNTQFFQLF